MRVLTDLGFEHVDGVERFVGEGFGRFGSSQGGVGLRAQGGELVLQVLQDGRVGRHVDGGLKGFDAGLVRHHVVGEAGNGVFDGAEARALRGHVGGQLLQGVAQRGDVGVGHGLSGRHVGADHVEEAAHHEGSLVTREAFVTAEGAIGEADDDAQVRNARDGFASPVACRDVREGFLGRRAADRQCS